MLDAGTEFDRLFNSVTCESTSQTLFDVDCRWISTQAMQDHARVPRVAAFVLMSIRQPFLSIASRMTDYDKHGIRSRFLSGWKPDCLAHVKRHSRTVWADCLAFQAGDITQAECLWRLTRIPGLGAAKAAFLGQLLTGGFACLDTLNLRAMGYHKRSFRVRKDDTSETNQRRVIGDYLAACNAQGDPGYWWDTWCTRLAERKLDIRGYSIPWTMPVEDISRLHRLAVVRSLTH